jgi:hypothetical protein
MRLSVFAYGLGAVALVGLVYATDPAAAAKSKMGCQIGKEVWNASVGKCVPGKSKYAGAAHSKAPKKGTATSAPKK